MTDEVDTRLPYAAFGGAPACCFGLEPLGGTPLIGGIATTHGLSAGLTYATVVGLGGVLTALLGVGYQRIGQPNRGYRD